MPERVRFAEALDPLMEDPAGLRPHPGNPRNGDVEAIVDSLVRNGCYRPIYATRDGMIVAGHHLYMALLELSAERVPVLRLDLDDKAADRILLADNRVADRGRYDEGLLLELLRGTEDLLGTGYDESDVARLLAALEPDPMPDPDSVWVTLHCRVPQQAALAFEGLANGDNDGQRLLSLLRQAGWSG